MDNLIKIEDRKILKEELNLINRLNTDEIQIETLNKLSDYPENKNLSVKSITPAGEYLRENLDEILEKIGFNANPNEIYIELTNTKVKKLSSKDDKLLIQAINSIEDIDDSISKTIERFREWYILYFPELENINNNENYIKLIVENETREKILENNPQYFEAYESTGADLNPEDLNVLNDFAKSIFNLQKSRNNIVKYIEVKMNSIAPNLTDLVGATLGAKLISHSGGVKNLALYPSSTIQIMGAEKALYNYKKTGGNPPKHGLIYQHPTIRSSKWWNRGKISRLLALKISLAIKRESY